MEKLNVPENILEKDGYNVLSSLQKGEYTTNLLKEILRLNPLGITASQIEKNTYLSHSVIWHHLEILASRGECMRVEHGDVDVYHSNRVIDSLKDYDLLEDGTDLHFMYNFDLVENTFGNYVRIQRQGESRSSAHTTRSGIIVPYNLVDTIANTLIKIKEEHLKESHLNEEKDRN